MYKKGQKSRTMGINSRATQIIDLFKEKPGMEQSCNYFVKHFIKTQNLEPHTAKYLSGAISTVLHKLVKKGMLEYSDKKTSLGGHIYKLKQ